MELAAMIAALGFFFICASIADAVSRVSEALAKSIEAERRKEG